MQTDALSQRRPEPAPIDLVIKDLHAIRAYALIGQRRAEGASHFDEIEERSAGALRRLGQVVE